jgi:hypothetical protein
MLQYCTVMQDSSSIWERMTFLLSSFSGIKKSKKAGSKDRRRAKAKPLFKEMRPWTVSHLLQTQCLVEPLLCLSAAILLLAKSRGNDR